MDDVTIAVAPQCHPCLGLAGLQTPFTWYSPVMTIESCHEVDDKLALLGTPWAVLLNRLHSAYSYFSNAHFEAGRSRLVDCYMQLVPALADECEIVGNHREALRHVFDATWAAMEQLEAMRRNGGLHIHQHNPDWKDFTKNIKPYSKLSKAQQAAICAIRGTLASDPGGLREAIKLNPSEGEWHYKLGYLLEEERGTPPGRHPPSSEELSSLQKGYRLRPNVDSMTRLARSLSGTGTKGVEKAVALFEEALRLYPTNPRVLFQSGCFLGTLREQLGREDHPSSFQLFERCLDAVDGQCAYVLFKLGTLSLFDSKLKKIAPRGADNGKSIDYFDRALAVDPVAVGGFQKELVRFGEACKRDKEAKEAREARAKRRK